ncbi:hypothetical protein RI129_000673 [Pyrocoelia pectoralis]|uniref:Uncharacterized protein n=1 Tax=Pyrocoelia pectoralis TaxID=417401 RepID=A0AAN7VS36_9COLE
MPFTREQKSEISTIISDTITALLDNEKFIETLSNKIMQVIEIQVCKITAPLISEIEEVKKSNVTTQELDNLRQYTRRNSLRIFGIKEDINEDVERKMIETFNTYCNVNMKAESIDRCHRIGKPSDNINKPRAIIVKFTSYRYKNLIYRSKTKFRNTKIVIKEDLTRTRLELYKEACSKFGFKNVWTVDGVIKTKIKGRAVSINKMDDLDAEEQPMNHAN